VKTLVAALLLVISGCSQAGGSSSPAVSPAGSVGPGPSAEAAAIHVRDFTLDPKAITSGGSAVALAVTNDGPTVHNVTIRDSSGTVLAATKDLKPGQSETLSVQIKPGAYVMYCSLPGHESLGIKGTLTVTK
jgi:uncharacterized cupredoxin-like copper-binding protein